MKTLGMVLLVLALPGFIFAAAVSAPEISPASGVAGLALVSGAVLVIRGRRKS